MPTVVVVRIDDLLLAPAPIGPRGAGAAAGRDRRGRRVRPFEAHVAKLMRGVQERAASAPREIAACVPGDRRHPSIGGFPIVAFDEASVVVAVARANESQAVTPGVRVGTAGGAGDDAP